jgi:hypothetical protein
MTFRAARLMSVPAGVTLLCVLAVRPGHWSIAPVWTPALGIKAAVAPVTPALVKRGLPRIIAVNPRVARRVNDLRPTVKIRLQRVINRLSKRVVILVTSAQRTREEQAALRPTFGIKARPGTSAHEDGRAIDVNVLVDGERISPRLNDKVIGAAMASEGFRYLGRKDPVHYSMPKEEISPKVTTAPDLNVMTMDQMLELKAQNAAADTAQAEKTQLAASAQPPSLP